MLYRAIFDSIYFFSFLTLSPLLMVKSFSSQSIRNFLLKRVFNPSFPEKKTDQTIWLHGASAGEIGLALRYYDQFSEKQKKMSFFTTNTISGVNTLKKAGFHESQFSVLPFDFSIYIELFVSRLKPKTLILVEMELWPNLISIVARKAKIIVINGRISDKHFKNYIRFRRIYKGLLNKIDLIIAGDSESEQRFSKLGALPAKLKYFGNSKLTISSTNESSELDSIRATYLGNKASKLLIFGSIQPKEVPFIVESLNNLKKQKKLEFQSIIIPRHLEKKEEFKSEFSNFSITFDSAKDLWIDEGINLKVIFKIGVLKQFYELADFIFVGGSLVNRGGQNMVEAISYKKSVSVGPYTQNFKQIVSMLQKKDGISVVKNSDEMTNWMLSCLENKSLHRRIAANAFQYLKENKEAFGKSLEVIQSFLHVFSDRN